MTTKYGTIPTTTTTTTTTTSTPGEWWPGTEFGTLRPWDKMVSLTFPNSFRDAFLRMKTNIPYYHINYGIIISFVFFLSLLWSPGALVLFIVIMAAWLFLYFIREDPVIIFNCVVDDRLIVIVLTIVTAIFILTRSAVSIVVGILVGMVAVVLHSVLSSIDDLQN